MSRQIKMHGSQNNRFHDAYCPEIDIDLSKNLFCIDVNSVDGFDQALRDSMKIINLTGYDLQQKKNIVSSHTISKLEKRTNIMVSIDDGELERIIQMIDRNERSGMREVEWGIENIFERLLLLSKSQIAREIYGIDIDTKKIKLTVKLF